MIDCCLRDAILILILIPRGIPNIKHQEILSLDWARLIESLLVSSKTNVRFFDDALCLLWWCSVIYQWRSSPKFSCLLSCFSARNGWNCHSKIYALQLAAMGRKNPTGWVLLRSPSLWPAAKRLGFSCSIALLAPGDCFQPCGGKSTAMVEDGDPQPSVSIIGESFLLLDRNRSYGTVRPSPPSPPIAVFKRNRFLTGERMERQTAAG